MSGFQGKQVASAVIDRARGGDTRAHEVIFRTFSAPVYTLALRMTGSASTAEDLLQDTFIEVMRSIGRYRADASLGTWIRTVAVSKCLMYMRSAWRRRATLFRDLPDDHHASIGLTTPEAPVQLRLDLERALTRLPDVSRIVVLLHDVEGYTHREIAELMGMSVSFSKSQLARARGRLRETLASHSENALDRHEHTS